MNQITINIDELLAVEDNSITDYHTIRQIGLLSCTENKISKDIREALYKKVKREFQYCGLYPYVIESLTILPESK